MEDERRYLIGLNLIPELSPRRMGILLSHFSSPREIWTAPAAALEELPGFSSVAARIAAARDEGAIDRELARAERIGARIITLLDPEYPPLLREIEDPPAVLYASGGGIPDFRRGIAIVGTRRASGYGRTVAHQLAAELARLGIVIVSGLAVGIDTAAHRGAVDGGGTTVAVLGSGLGHIYPAANVRLAREIEREGGLILSEFPIDTRPAKWTFPQRNRIISGLSRGVVVVEAPERSGALITARLAAEQGREVFAVPGPITSTSSRGTNRLIQDGARPVLAAADVVSEFPDLKSLLRPARSEEGAEVPSLTPTEQRVYEMIGLEPTHIDDIIAAGNISPTEAAHTLLMLQMKDLIREVEGRRYIKRP